jgi:hypothetical protein
VDHCHVALQLQQIRSSTAVQSDVTLAKAKSLSPQTKPVRSKLGHDVIHSRILFLVLQQHWITLEHIRRVLKTTRPSVAPNEVDRLRRM